MNQATTNGRKAYSCQQCRDKKIKCDRRRTCANCRRKHLVCIWPQNGTPLDGGTRLPSTESPASRRSAEHPTQSVSRPSHWTADNASTVLEAEQLDHSILDDAERDAVHRETGSALHPGFPFVSISAHGQTDPMIMHDMLCGLPERRRYSSQGLRMSMRSTTIDVPHKLERVEWIHHPLHPPTFLAQYNKFWISDAVQRPQIASSGWLALLYIVLCLGLHFSDNDALQDSALEAHLLSGCESALAHSDCLTVATSETVQTIICLNLYFNSKNQASKARSLLAFAIRAAISLGWSRIPDEKACREDDHDGVLEREIGRRLWWSLVAQDAYTASTSGFTYLINLTHASTGQFANIDDEDIGGVAFRSKPMTEMTALTYHVAKIEFALIVRDFIDAVNKNWPEATYDMVMHLDKRFREVYERLPTPLRPDQPQPFDLSSVGSRRYLVEQRIFMGITLHNRLMRLHRPHMQKGYDDPNYAYSTQTCTGSAYALIDLAKQSAHVLCRWWVVLVHVWTAGLILSADLVRMNASGRDCRRQREAADAALSLLETNSRASPVAMRAFNLLRSLLQQYDHRTVQGENHSVQPGNGMSSDVALGLHSSVEAGPPSGSALSSNLTSDPAQMFRQNQSYELFESLFHMNEWVFDS